MPTDLNAIALAAAAAFDGVTGVNAHDVEPGAEGLKQPPVVTLLFRGLQRVTDAAPLIEEAAWTWNVYVYVSVRPSLADGQRKLMEIAPSLFNAIRDSAALGGAGGCEMVDLIDPLEEPVMSEANGHLFKRLELRAYTTET